MKAVHCHINLLFSCANMESNNTLGLPLLVSSIDYICNNRTGITAGYSESINLGSLVSMNVVYLCCINLFLIATVVSFLK